MNKILLIVLLAAVLGTGFYFYKSKLLLIQNPGLGEDEPRGSRMQANPAVEIKEFTMTAKQFQFDPSVITVKQGDRVRIKITSLDVAHGFGLPDFGIDQNIEPGKEVTVDFVADKKGEFPFHCSVMCGAGHKEMIGKLIVE